MNYFKNVLLGISTLALSLVAFSYSPVSAAGEYVTLSAFSGYPGSTIQISGGGYPASQKILVHIANVSNSYTSFDKTTTSTASGSFGPVDLTIPASAIQGNLSITSSLVSATGKTSLIASNGFYVTPYAPSLAVKSDSNNPFDIVSVTGAGFMPGESVDVTLATSSASIVTDSKGSITNLAIDIPSVASGTYTVKGVGKISKAIATNYFYIGDFFASAYPSSFFVLPEDVLSFSGGGFAKSETVNVYDGITTTLLSTFGVGLDGSFKNLGGITIPYEYANSSKSFRLVGAKSKAQVYVTSNIGQFFPSATPSSYYILPSQILSFNGSSFAKSELVTVTEGLSTTPLTTFTTDVKGNFLNAGGITINAKMSGTSPIFKLTGSKSKSVATVSVGVGQYNATISPSAYYIKPGALLNFTGSGFASSEKIELFVDKNPVSISNVNATILGSFKSGLQTMIDYSASGTSKTFRAVGVTSGAQATVTLGIASLSPQVSLSSYYVKPGQVFNVTASDFAPGELVSIQLDNVEILQVTSNLVGGILAQPIPLPFGKTITTVVTLKGLKSNAIASSTLTRAAFNPTVNANNYFVLPGDKVTFSGSDFAASEEVFVMNGLTKVMTITTDLKGALPATAYTVPFGSKGSLDLKFVGQKSNAMDVISIGLGAFYPSVESDSYYVQPGNSVNIKGGGFYSGETVTLTSGITSTTAIVTAKGTFDKVAFAVPFGGKSTINISVTGNISKASAILPLTLAPFSPQISPSSYYINAGSVINFVGSSFVPGEKITYSLNKTTLGTVTADTKGGLILNGVLIPFGASSANFSFMGELSQTSLAFSIGVAALNPSVQLNNYYAVGGSPITISGSNFSNSESVAIVFGGTSLGNVIATATGTFSLKTTVPFNTSGEKAVVATGVTSKATSKTTFTQAPIYASTQLGIYAGKPGTKISFLGSGYLPGETIEVTTDRTDTNVVNTFTASATGNFNNSAWTIPALFTEGNLTLTIKGKNSFTTNKIVFYVTK